MSDLPKIIIPRPGELREAVMRRVTGMDGFAHGGVIPRRKDDGHGEEIHTVVLVWRTSSLRAVVHPMLPRQRPGPPVIHRLGRALRGTRRAPGTPGTERPVSWIATYGPEEAADDVHVIPEDDLMCHLAEDCPCGPSTEPVPRDDGSMGWLITHHSLDGRERFE